MESEINEFEYSMVETSAEFQNTVIAQPLNFHNYGLQSSGETDQNDPGLRKRIIYKFGRNYICLDLECKQKFTCLNNLREHLREKHPTLFPSLFTSNGEPHKCDICGRYFQHKKSLQGHKRKKHNLYNSNAKKHKCPLCSQMFERRLINGHFKDSHNVLLKTIKLNFDSYAKFCEWKKAIEKVTKTLFSKQSKRVANGVSHHPFICHRSGTFRKEGAAKRKLRAPGSRKIDAFCPATMNVVVAKNGKCQIRFQTQHVGHENELQHLNLTYEERAYVAEKLASNLPLNEILIDIRNSASTYGSERLCLLTRRDLHNVKASFLKNAQFNASEAKLDEKLVCSLRDIHNKHAESEHIRADITQIKEGWVLTSVEHNEIYLIKENLKSCNCTFICIYCNVCIKSYSCSCSDSAIEENMCKHIHFFCMERNKLHNDLESTNSSDYNNDVTEITSNSEECDYLQTSNSKECDYLQSSNSKECDYLQSSNSKECDYLQSSNSKECDYLQTNNSMCSNLSSFSSDVSLSSNDLLKIDKPSVSEKVNTLKNKFCELFDSIKTEEEYKLSESTFEELTAKLKSLQNHSVTKNDTAIPAKQQPLKSVFLSGSIQDQPSSNATKTIHMPLLLKIPDSSGQNAKFYCVNFTKEKNNS